MSGAGERAAGEVEVLAGIVRAGLQADEEAALAAQEITPGPWTVDYKPGGWDNGAGMLVDANRADLWDCEESNRLAMAAEPATHAARHDPARVLAQVGAMRGLLDAILAEAHGVDEDGDPCPRRGTTAKCQCGRDARVLRLLRHLAAAYQTTTEEEQ